MAIGVKGSSSTSTSAIPRNKCTRVKNLSRLVTPTPTDKSNGSRIHAQRKFAQGQGTVSSPAVTPIKEKKKEKVRKKVLPPSPPFSPAKRPKTEDFLTFLCYRDTPAAKQYPHLDFFNYATSPTSPPILNGESHNTSDTSKSSVQNHNEKISKSSVQKKAEQHATTTESQKSLEKKQHHQNDKKSSEAKQSSSSSTANISSNHPTPNKSTKTTTNNNSKEGKTTSFAKVGRAVVTKERESVKSPRINEQDAKFAMTALKLKYHEKKLATKTSTPTTLLVAQKVKKKSVILTRSKSHKETSPKSTNGRAKFFLSKKNRSDKPHSRNVPSPDIIDGIRHYKAKMQQTSSSDSETDKKKTTTTPASSSSEEEIKVKSKEKASSKPQPVRSLRNGKELVTKTTKSSISNTNSKENDGKKESSNKSKVDNKKEKEKSNEKDKIQEKEKQKTKSLSSSTSKSSASSSKKSIPARIGTRSTHRDSTSPLRELPMYTLKKKAEKKKKAAGKKKKTTGSSSKSDEKEKDKKSCKRESSTSNNDKNLKAKETRKKESKLEDDFELVRPPRKTKENAAIYLGLLNKDFSSDEHESMSDRSEHGEESESMGSTSSSETKFLEKHYQASMKKLEIECKSKVKRKEEDSDKESSRKSTVSKKSTSSKIESKKNKDKESSRALRNKNERDLKSKRSNSKNTKKASTSSDSSPATTRRSHEKDKANLATRSTARGAVRKSAKVTPRRNKHPGGTSSSSSSSSDSEESSTSTVASSESEQENNEEQDDKMSITSNKSNQEEEKMEIENDDDADSITSETKNKSGSDSEEEEEGKDTTTNKTSKTKKKKSRKCCSNSSADEIEDDEEEAKSDSSSENEASSESSDDSVSSPSPPKKTTVTIAIQCDMDADDEAEPLLPQTQISSPPSMSSSTPQPSLQLPTFGASHLNESTGTSYTPPLSSSTSSASSSTSRSKTSHNDTHRQTPQSHSSSSSHHHFQQQQQHQGPHIPDFGGSIPMPSFIPPPLPQFMPFPPPQARQEFYQTSHGLHMGSIHLVGNTTTTDFLGLPSFLTPRLMPPAPMLSHFSSSSIHSSGSSLETHIRSVAANLDIPLVRPHVGPENHLNHLSLLSGPRAPLPPPPISIASTSSHHVPLTRPVNIWSVASTVDSLPHQHSHSQHYSAFRVPMPGKVIHHQSSSVVSTQMGMSTSTTSHTLLPLSIIQPQIHQRPSTSQQQQQQQQQQQPSTSHSKHQQQRSSSSSSSNSSTAANRHQQQPSSQQPSTSSSLPPTTQEYSSILQKLPNVSIVPRFDRNSKAHIIPSELDSIASGSKSSTTKNNKGKPSKSEDKKEEKVKEKVGRKRKHMPLLQATSPLTVRKDSTNPVTYIGISSRKKSIEVDINERQVEKGNDDTFHKLLQMKKPHEKEKHEKHGKSVDDKVKSSSSASTSSKVSTSSTKHEIISLIDDDDEDEKFKPHVDSDNDDEDEEKPNMKKKEGGSSKDSKITEAPTFYPSEKDFQNPMKYIEEIRVKAASFGIAKIIPPKSFRPDCNVEDDMRFTAYNHYIHKMYQRWGTNVHETTTIKEYLRKSDVDMSSVPMIGGMEIDLSTLYHTVQFYGGLKNVIEKQKWQKVSDTMYIPKAVNDRASKLNSIYVKYVLPYEMLSDQERKKLMDQVEAKWKSRQEKMLKNRDKDNIELNDDEEDDPFEEVDECIIKGKSTSLGVYYRVARNTFSMLFHGKEPSPQEIEDDYWKMIEERTRHLCVYSGSIDCEGGGLGFPLKASSKHPWNLKVFVFWGQ